MAVSAWKDGAQAFIQGGRRYTCFVVGYNWVVATTMLPAALLMVWLLALLRAPVSVACCIAYLVFEVTAFWMERNWSRVAVLRFWRVSIPLVVVHTLCCLLLARHDPLGCLLFATLCLCMREALFEFVEASVEAGGYSWKERLTGAFMGGSTYGLIIAALVGSAYVMVRVTRLEAEGFVSPTFELLFAVVLPMLRFLLRLILTQSLAGAIITPLNVKTAEQKPKLDTLVMYGDFTFALTMFLEVPFAFVFLYIPHSATFWLAAVANTLLDVLFVYVLDTLQQRRLRLAALVGGKTRDLQQQSADEGGTARWSPVPCLHRPTSMIAAAMNRAIDTQEPTEVSRLAAAAPAAQRPAAAAQQPVTAEPVESESSMQTCVGQCQERLGAAFQRCFPPRSEESPPSPSMMSPRVSLLMDEYDAMLIKCSKSQTVAPVEEHSDTALTIYLYQERKIPFLAHLLGSTVAVAFAAVSAAVVGLHSFETKELVARVIGLLALRIVADMAACWVLERLCYAIPRDRIVILWESRPELSTLHGWLFRMLVSICPLFAVVAAATAVP